MKIADALLYGSEILHAASVYEFRAETALLLSLTIGRDRTFLIAHPEYELTEGENSRFAELTQRRANREPFQYISGRQEFFGLEFQVSPGVLIPRPETELLVERAIEILSKKDRPADFCEIGTGSGCISVSILHTMDSTSGLGTDISDKALDVTLENARKHRVDGRLKLYLSDVYDVLGVQKFDLIVSNPPYVPLEDITGLQAEVRDFEPHIALTDGGDGLSIIRRIIADAPKFLIPGGRLLLEIGFGQSGHVIEMFDREIWFEPAALPDLQGIPRIVDAQLRNLLDCTPLFDPLKQSVSDLKLFAT